MAIERLFLTIAVCLTLPLLSPLAMNQNLKFYEQPDLFQKEIVNLIPLGISIADAQKTMEQQGLECSSEKYQGESYIRCRREEGFIVSRVWIVVITYENNQVKKVESNVGLLGT